MVDFLKDILLVLGRIITIIPLLLFITLYMGKRAIGQLPVFDFLIIVTLGAVVGADIADPGINHLPTAVAIIALAIFQKLVSKWKIANRKVGKLLTFEPTVVIQHGKFLNKNMRDIQFSIDNILQMLREKEIFNIAEVETAVIEANGSLSVLKKSQKRTVTLEDMKLAPSSSAIAFPVVVEGDIYTDVLSDFKLNESWLRQQLAEQGVQDMADVFFASINRHLDLHISLKDEQITTPPIRH